MKLLKFLFITVAAGIGLIILLVAGASFLLKTEKAHQYLQDRINQTIPGNITWSHLDVALWDGRMEFRDLALEGPGNRNFLTNLGMPEFYGTSIALGTSLFPILLIIEVLNKGDFARGAVFRRA